MRKGQAAMEFLMTYGWAILVVLAAIGALADPDLVVLADRATAHLARPLFRLVRPRSPCPLVAGFHACRLLRVAADAVLIVPANRRVADLTARSCRQFRVQPQPSLPLFRATAGTPALRLAPVVANAQRVAGADRIAADLAALSLWRSLVRAHNSAATIVR